MSFTLCHTTKCPWRIRTGLKRSGPGKADGRYCWRCRRARNKPLRVFMKKGRIHITGYLKGRI